jgi:D-alanyl-lipoteichoic acid acyltransferase DltB (MBOAT superfamily)
MLFNSIEFAIFLPIIFILYWLLSNKPIKFQNILLLVASYFFYACWDWRFLFLLIFSTLLDYFTGIKMCDSKNEANKKIWFWISISINLGFLGVFKYYNFFAESFADAVSNFGLKVNPWTLQVILPVGISFYTFHGLSYVIDIYKGRIKAEKNFIDYSVFVSFFPLLVAGPIERATHLLPQIQKKRTFDYAKAVDGLRQILWGLFKKIVIADNAAVCVNAIFADYGNMPASSLWLAGILFSFQIYGDFSGYSDIALGTARLFGIDLLRNFAFPYFSRDIAEFWRRWHISLSSWFRDYLYIPLGGSKGGIWVKIRNTFIIFLVSGFWHGANWTFIAWGFFHALFFIPLLLKNNNRKHVESISSNSHFPTLKEFFQMLSTFTIVMFLWIIFRSNSLTDTYLYFIKMFDFSTLFNPPTNALSSGWGWYILLVLFILMDWFSKNKLHGLYFLDTIKSQTYRYCVYIAFILVLIYFSSTQPASFIYFQF